MYIGFFISYKGIIVQIPVNPEKIEIQLGTKHHETEIVKLGDIVVPKLPKLATLSFESFFPRDNWGPWINTFGSFFPSSFYLMFIKRIMNDAKPCRLTITGLETTEGLAYDHDVVIEEFNYDHRSGDFEDTYYTIKFKEYKDYSVSIINQADTNMTTEDALKSAGNTISMLGVKVPTSLANFKATDVVIGAIGVFNGLAYLDSYGKGVGRALNKLRVKINLTNKQAPYGAHITDLNGTSLGWVDPKEVDIE